MLVKCIKILMFTLLSIVMFMFTSVKVNAETELLNIDFENSVGDFTSRGSSTIEKVSNISYKGTGSLYVKDRTASWQGSQINISSIANAGGVYDISCYAMQSTGNNEEIKFTLQYVDASDATQYIQLDLKETISGTWTSLYVNDYKIPLDAKDIYVYVETPENLIDFYIDNFRVQLVSTEKLSDKKGDVNGTGKFDIFDVIAFDNYLKGESIEYKNIINADMNSDGILNVLDIAILKNELLFAEPEIEEPIIDTVISNPVIWADVPDVSVIRVGDTYYMVSTTMYFTPGAPIMKSKDMVSWEIVNYVYDTLSNSDASNLINGKNAYGRGQWATSLNYKNGTFYAFFASNDQGKSYVFQTKDIENGKWTKSEISGIYHDASLLFDDDGKVYLVYGGGSNVKIKEMNDTVTGFKQGGVDKILYETGIDGLCEGSQAYKINGQYYVINIAWPNSGTRRRMVLCYKSDTLLGKYERKTVLDSAMGYYNAGVAQGGLFNTPNGDWYSLLFQDHGAVGRIPVLVPVKWVDGWPVMGVNGEAPKTFTIKTNYKGTYLAKSDEFDYDLNKLKLEWQWNHNPDNTKWSVTARKGFLRLNTVSVVDGLLKAKNTLTQRTEGPKCSSQISMNVSAMKAGDYAGLSAFQSAYGMVGVRVDDSGSKKIFMATSNSDGTMKIEQEAALNASNVYFKIDFNFSKVDSSKNITTSDKALFYYSLNGKDWTRIGVELSMRYTLDLFTGYRSAIFNYATKSTGGYVDVDYFRYSREEWQDALK